jgi:hypothetical protein
MSLFPASALPIPARWTGIGVIARPVGLGFELRLTG